MVSKAKLAELARKATVKNQYDAQLQRLKKALKQTATFPRRPSCGQ